MSEGEAQNLEPERPAMLRVPSPEDVYGFAPEIEEDMEATNGLLIRAAASADGRVSDDFAADDDDKVPVGCDGARGLHNHETPADACDDEI